MALATYNFIIKHRAGKNKPRRHAIKATLRCRGSAKGRHHATITLKDFGNVGPLTRSERPFRCIGKRTFYRGVALIAIG